MHDPPPSEKPPPRKPRWTPLGWLLAGIAFAFAPAVLVELTIAQQDTFWEEFSGIPDGQAEQITDAHRALRFEANLRQNTAASVILMGNSVVASNVARRDIAKDCCEKPTKVIKAAVTRLTMLETAMLGPTLTELKPDLVVLSMNRWDAAGTDGWEGVRFYDPGVAWRLSNSSEILHHRSAHLLGVLGHWFLLFRHRLALLDIFGDKTGLPLGEMIHTTSDQPWTGEEVQELQLPTIETRALRDLSRQLSAAGARLLVFSAPTRELLLQPPPGQPPHPALEFQAKLEQHLTQAAREEGFLFVPHRSFNKIELDMLQDSIHLRKEGRRHLSTQLSAMVRRALEADDETWSRAVAAQ